MSSSSSSANTTDTSLQNQLSSEEERQLLEQIETTALMMRVLVGLYVALVIVAIVVGVHMSRQIRTLEDTTVSRALKSVENASTRLATQGTSEKLTTSLLRTIDNMARQNETVASMKQQSTAAAKKPRRKK